jgi:hypothetical protein
LRYHPEKIDISIIDLHSGHIEALPESKGLWNPGWSPSGRYILALTADAVSFNSKSLLVFDLQTNRWKKIAG